MAAEIGSPYRRFRFNEVRQTSMGVFYAAFIEWTPQPRWTLVVKAENLGDRAVRQDRHRFDQPRDGRDPDRIQRRIERTGPYLGLTVRRSLGAA